jgi:hypothetical protein
LAFVGVGGGTETILFGPCEGSLIKLKIETVYKSLKKHLYSTLFLGLGAMPFPQLHKPY